MKSERRNFVLAAVAGLPGISLLWPNAAPGDRGRPDVAAESLFMRPAWIDVSKGQVAHLQLFNPPDSGVDARLVRIKLAPCPEFHIGYGSGAMFKDTNFFEKGNDRSYGLPIDPDGKQQQARCRSRYLVTGDKNLVGFGQLDNVRNPNAITILEEPYILAPGRSLIIRSKHNVCASFFWVEEPIRSSGPGGAPSSC